jgi:hypothetical protein
MQVVFVHGVNNRDAADGMFRQEVAARTDRLSRLAFAGNATIRNPYWGKFGRPERSLGSVPKARGGAQTLGLAGGPTPGAGPDFDPTGFDLREIVGTLSIDALQEAAKLQNDDKRREIENYWVAAADFAEMRPHPAWLTQSASLKEISTRLGDEVEVMRNLRPLGEGWHTPRAGLNDLAARRLRDWSSGFLAQFLGDAFMFFSRREAGRSVRREITASILDAARNAEVEQQPLVLIGHSMGGSVLHDILTDPEEIRALQADLGRPLAIDLFLSVGTQIGLFAELGQFTPSGTDHPLSIPCRHYWNVFDFADTLSFLCSPSLPGAVDLEINTAGGVLRAHNAYFDNAVFYSRLRARLTEVGLVS